MYHKTFAHSSIKQGFCRSRVLPPIQLSFGPSPPSLASPLPPSPRIPSPHPSFFLSRWLDVIFQNWFNGFKYHIHLNLKTSLTPCLSLLTLPLRILTWLIVSHKTYQNVQWSTTHLLNPYVAFDQGLWKPALYLHNRHSMLST